jgi:Domain of unknown function (DUF6265)
MISLVLFSALMLPPPDDAPARKGAPPKLADLAWLVGHWRTPPEEKSGYEEHWSEPAGGAMMGMFRILQGGRPSLYEFLLIEEGADGVFLRLRHYRPGMVDVDKAPFRIRLVEATGSRVVFENPEGERPRRIAYRLEGNELTAVVETTRDGKPVQFSLKMRRAPAK